MQEQFAIRGSVCKVERNRKCIGSMQTTIEPLVAKDSKQLNIELRQFVHKNETSISNTDKPVIFMEIVAINTWIAIEEERGKDSI